MIKRLSALLRTLKRFILFFIHFDNWREAFARFLRKEPIIYLRLRGGHEIFASKVDDVWSIFHEIFIERCYTRPHFYTPQDGDVILDIGANIGMFSIHLIELNKNLKIHSFEPAESTFARLENNVKKNKMNVNVTLHNVAIFNKETSITLTSDDFAGSTSAFIQTNTNKSTEEVRTITLTNFIKTSNLNKIALIKMDIEGAEIEALSTLTDEDFTNIKRFAIEYHDNIRKGSFDYVKKLMERHYQHIETYPISPNGELGIMLAYK